MPINDPNKPRPPKKPVSGNPDMYYDGADTWSSGIQVWKWNTLTAVFEAYAAGTYTADSTSVSVAIDENGDSYVTFA